MARTVHWNAMPCSHAGFHDIRTAYDHKSGVLRYFFTCEHCGARLREARHEEYRPSFRPNGNPGIQTPPTSADGLTTSH